MASTESPKKKRWSTVFKKKDRTNSQLPTISNSDQTSSQAQNAHSSYDQLSSQAQNGRSSYGPTTSASSQYNSTYQNNPVDSAYASSEPPSVNGGDANIVPVENNGRFRNVASDRNLELNKTTGDVMDKDTGEVVSTVTTTTTTTTTTTLKKGKNGETVVDVQTRPAGETSTERIARDTSTSRPTEYIEPAAGLVEAPADNAVPAPNTSNDSAQSQDRRSRSPMIPARSPHRASRELDSMQYQSTPSQSNNNNIAANSAGYNFSHPTRANPRQSGDWAQNPTTQPSLTSTSTSGQPSARSTFESLKSLAKEQSSPETYANLKAAAKGLHGVGETLRGAINNEFDTRIAPDRAANAGTFQKNQAIIERGRAEMQMGRRTPQQLDTWNNAGGPAHVPGYSNPTVSPIEPQGAQWQERTPSRSSSQKRGLRKLIKKKKSG